MESIALTIKGLNLKSSGTNSYGPWHIWGVEDTEGKKHSTFLEGLIIGETYYFLREMEDYVSKQDGKTYKSSKLTGFDNVRYEKEHRTPRTTEPPEAPVQNNVVNTPSQPSSPAQSTNQPQGQSGTYFPEAEQGFTAEDRRKLEDMGLLLQAIYDSLNQQ